MRLEEPSSRPCHKPDEFDAHRISLRSVSTLFSHVYQDCIHKATIILHNNLQRDSHNPYGLPTAVT
jgi:hypothetical protein